MSEFDKVIGYSDIKAELIRLCDVLKNMDKYKRLGVTMPRGLLLYGDPGIGKTMMAKSFIKESGYKSFVLRKDKPDGDFVNEIRDVFSKAKEEHSAIVFLDDMDKFANEDDYHRDAEEYVTVQACIDDCRDTGVFVLATANDKYCMPDSLIRAGRFDKSIEMKYPTGDDAKKIVEYYLSQKQVMGDIDIDDISRLLEGKSCAVLEMVINEAGIIAGFDNRDRIEQDDLLKACMRMIFDAPESVERSEEKYLRNVAIHEAGHALVAEVLDPDSVSLVSICHYTGATEGVVVIHKADDFDFSIIAQEHEVIRKLGGKAATEVVLGVPDIGCNDDLHRAFDLVTKFVDNYCSYGFDAFVNRQPSDHLLENKERLVAVEMDRYYRQAKKIISENMELLNAIVQGLLEKKTLTYKDIREIFRENTGIAVNNVR